MAQKRDFFVDLISNVRSPIYLDNKIGNFVTQLHRRIELDKDWEVALVEISYHKTWPNVLKTTRFSVYDFNGSEFLPDATNRKKRDATETSSSTEKNLNKGLIKQGHYASLKSLMEKINEQLDAFSVLENSPKLTYNKISDLVTISAGSLNKETFSQITNSISANDKNNSVFPNLGIELEQMLGLVDENKNGVIDYLTNKKLHTTKQYEKMRNGNYKGYQSPDLDVGVYSLYVYSNIVYPQFVGDTSVKLLQCVEIPNNVKYKDQVVIRYSSPHYVPLICTSFETVEIDIKDDSGVTIPFQSGRVRLRLHFRQKQ